MAYLDPAYGKEGDWDLFTRYAAHAGLTVSSTRARISDGSLPPPPKPVRRLGNTDLYPQDSADEWAASIPAWREALPDRRAAERAQAEARQQHLREQQRAKEKAAADWLMEQQIQTRALELVRREREALKRGITVEQIEAENERQARSFDAMTGGVR